MAAELPGKGHVVVGADLADPKAVRAMVDAAAAALGGLDVLVNNAGVFDAAPDHRDELRGMAARLAAGARRQPRRRGERDLVRRPAHGRGGGHIVNVASRGAFRGEPKAPAYGASKAGIIAFGQSLARALGPSG